MIINHNITALNTHRQMSSATNAQASSMEKLSSGMRINKASDDAAGLSISEKMRGQIRGLEQGSRNAQDGISMMQTAEGALNETHDILQRMREVATQSANGTLTDADRGAIQDEMNQLTSEINRIGNTTEFNTQKLLAGDGNTSLKATSGIPAGTLLNGSERTTTEATQTITLTGAATAGNTAEITLNGISLAVTFTASGTNGGVAGDNQGYDISANGATANVALDASSNANNGAAGLRDAYQKMIDTNDTLKGQYVVSGTANAITITAVKGGTFEGAAGSIGAFAGTGTVPASAGANNGTTANAVAASSSIDFDTILTGTAAEMNTQLDDLVGTGFTVNGEQIEFYDSTEGAYTGTATGVAINTALAEGTAADKADALVKAIADTVGSQIEGVTVTANANNLVITANVAGDAGEAIEFSDGGIQEAFKTSFQIGANTGQSMTLEINDMRSNALGITGKAGDAGFTAANGVTNGSDDVKAESALNLLTKEDSTKSIAVLDEAIASVSAERSKLGANQNRLDHTINNLGTSAENLTAAESRIRDVDMAKEMMEQTKNSILAQASQAMLAQANQAPQAVLQLLR